MSTAPATQSPRRLSVEEETAALRQRLDELERHQVEQRQPPPPETDDERWSRLQVAYKQMYGPVQVRRAIEDEPARVIRSGFETVRVADGREVQRSRTVIRTLPPLRPEHQDGIEMVADAHRERIIPGRRSA